MSKVRRWSQNDVDVIFNLKYRHGWSEPQITDYIASHYGNGQKISVSRIRYVLRSRRPSFDIPSIQKETVNIQSSKQPMSEGENQSYNASIFKFAPNLDYYAPSQPIESVPAMYSDSKIPADPNIFLFEGPKKINPVHNYDCTEVLGDSNEIQMLEDETAYLKELLDSEKFSDATDDRTAFSTSYLSSLWQNQDLSSKNKRPNITSTPYNRFGGVRGAPMPSSSQNFDNFDFALDPLCDARLYEDFSSIQQDGARNFQQTTHIPHNGSRVPEMTINLENPEFKNPFILPLDMANWIVGRPDKKTVSLEKNDPTGRVTINFKNPKFYAGFSISENLLPWEACQELRKALNHEENLPTGQIKVFKPRSGVLDCETF